MYRYLNIYIYTILLYTIYIYTILLYTIYIYYITIYIHIMLCILFSIPFNHSTIDPAPSSPWPEKRAPFSPPPPAWRTWSSFARRSKVWRRSRTKKPGDAWDVQLAGLGSTYMILCDFIWIYIMDLWSSMGF